MGLLPVGCLARDMRGVRGAGAGGKA
jgi:hypothetical protein